MDFAQLGIRLDTNDLEKGLRQLKQLRPTGAGAAAAADKLSKSLSRTALAQERLAISTAKANKASAMEAIASGKLSKTKIMEQRAIIKAADAQIKASTAKSAHIKKLRDEIALQKQVTAATNAATAATAKNNAQLVGVASRFAGGGGGMRGPMVANDPANDMMPNRFNTANIAAQFQDIGVTAAMGMNPMTIALQQGTQLSAILNTMGDAPLKGLAAAFKSIINPISLVSIGMVGLIAVGVQFVDWASVASSGMDMLANVIENSTEAFITFLPVVLAIGTAFLMWKLSVITAGIVSMTQAVWGAVAALNAFLLANPFVLFIAGVTAGLAALYTFRDEIAQVLGFDLFDYAKKGVNMLIGAFVGAYNSILKIWSKLPAAFGDLTIQAVNNTTAGLRELINDYIWASNKFLRTDFTEVNFGKLSNPFEGAAKDVSATFQDEMNNALNGVDYVGIMGEKIRTGSKAVVEKLRQSAANVTSDEDGKKTGRTEAEKFEDILKTANLRIETLKAERKAIGMNEQAANRLRIETELLNRAKEKDINLTPERVASLKSIAAETAAIEERNRQLNESYELLSDTGRSFFQDLKKGLQDGKSAWESFGDAVTNALNRILDKWFEVSLDMVFDNVPGMSGGGGGGSGFLGSIADWLFNAKGNAFSPSGVEEYAKGGTFTNTVANNPTMFTFANGGKFGVMGEAGPEAVMPLRRGSDGSLGVQVVGGTNGGSPVTVNVINNSGSQARTEQRQTSNGKEIDVIIDDMVASKIGSTGTASNRAVQDANDRPLIRRG